MIHSPRERGGSDRTGPSSRLLATSHALTSAFHGYDDRIVAAESKPYFNDSSNFCPAPVSRVQQQQPPYTSSSSTVVEIAAAATAVPPSSPPRTSIVDSYNAQYSPTYHKYRENQQQTRQQYETLQEKSRRVSGAGIFRESASSTATNNSSSAVYGDSRPRRSSHAGISVYPREDEVPVQASPRTRSAASQGLLSRAYNASSRGGDAGSGGNGGNIATHHQNHPRNYELDHKYNTTTPSLQHQDHVKLLTHSSSVAGDSNITSPGPPVVPQSVIHAASSPPRSIHHSNSYHQYVASPSSSYAVQTPSTIHRSHIPTTQSQYGGGGGGGGGSSPPKTRVISLGPTPRHTSPIGLVASRTSSTVGQSHHHRDANEDDMPSHRRQDLVSGVRTFAPSPTSRTNYGSSGGGGGSSSIWAANNMEPRKHSGSFLHPSDVAARVAARKADSKFAACATAPSAPWGPDENDKFLTPLTSSSDPSSVNRFCDLRDADRKMTQIETKSYFAGPRRNMLAPPAESPVSKAIANSQLLQQHRDLIALQQQQEEEERRSGDPTISSINPDDDTTEIVERPIFEPRPTTHRRSPPACSSTSRDEDDVDFTTQTQSKDTSPASTTETNEGDTPAGKVSAGGDRAGEIQGYLQRILSIMDGERDEAKREKSKRSSTTSSSKTKNQQQRESSKSAMRDLLSNVLLSQQQQRGDSAGTTRRSASSGRRVSIVASDNGNHRNNNNGGDDDTLHPELLARILDREAAMRNRIQEKALSSFGSLLHRRPHTTPSSPSTAIRPQSPALDRRRPTQGGTTSSAGGHQHHQAKPSLPMPASTSTGVHKGANHNHLSPIEEAWMISQQIAITESQYEPGSRDVIEASEAQCRYILEDLTIRHISRVYGLGTEGVRFGGGGDEYSPGTFSEGGTFQFMEASPSPTGGPRALHLPKSYREAILTGSTPSAREWFTDARMVPRMARLPLTYRGAPGGGGDSTTNHNHFHTSNTNTNNSYVPFSPSTANSSATTSPPTNRSAAPISSSSTVDVSPAPLSDHMSTTTTHAEGKPINTTTNTTQQQYPSIPHPSYISQGEIEGLLKHHIDGLVADRLRVLASGHQHVEDTHYLEDNQNRQHHNDSTTAATPSVLDRNQRPQALQSPQQQHINTTTLTSPSPTTDVHNDYFKGLPQNSSPPPLTTGNGKMRSPSVPVSPPSPPTANSPAQSSLDDHFSIVTGATPSQEPLTPFNALDGTFELFGKSEGQNLHVLPKAVTAMDPHSETISPQQQQATASSTTPTTVVVLGGQSHPAAPSSTEDGDLKDSSSVSSSIAPSFSSVKSAAKVSPTARRLLDDSTATTAPQQIHQPQQQQPTADVNQSALAYVDTFTDPETQREWSTWKRTATPKGSPLQDRRRQTGGSPHHESIELDNSSVLPHHHHHHEDEAPSPVPIREGNQSLQASPLPTARPPMAAQPTVVVVPHSRPTFVEPSQSSTNISRSSSRGALRPPTTRPVLLSRTTSNDTLLNTVGSQGMSDTRSNQPSPHNNNNNSTSNVSRVATPPVTRVAPQHHQHQQQQPILLIRSGSSQGNNSRVSPNQSIPMNTSAKTPMRGSPNNNNHNTTINTSVASFRTVASPPPPTPQRTNPVPTPQLAPRQQQHQQYNRSSSASQLSTPARAPDTRVRPPTASTPHPAIPRTTSILNSQLRKAPTPLANSPHPSSLRW